MDEQMIELLRDGEWWQTVVRGPNPTSFSADLTHVARQAADRIEELAAHSVMAGKLAEQRKALEAAQVALRNSMPVFPDVERQVAAALAPHPKGME